MELYILIVYICLMNKQNKEAEDKCILCHGTGKYVLPQSIKTDDVEVKRHLTIELFNKGYGIRQIQRVLGYKSPRSTFLIIQSYKNKKV